MKVTIKHPFIKGHDAFSLGQTVELDDDFATELLNAKMAEAVKEERKETATKKKTETPEHHA